MPWKRAVSTTDSVNDFAVVDIDLVQRDVVWRKWLQQSTKELEQYVNSIAVQG